MSGFDSHGEFLSRNVNCVVSDDYPYMVPKKHVIVLCREDYCYYVRPACFKCL